MDSPSVDIGSSDARSPRAILLAVGFAVFVAADDLTVVTTMLRPIINDLGLVLPDGLDDAAWVVNAYLVAFVAVMPIAGRLSDVYGRRQVFVGAYLVFLVGTVVIPLSSSLGPFLIGRVLTALGGGAMVPVALAVVGDVYPVRSRARALGTLAAIETLGWVWGPLYGAVLVRFFNWQTQFWLNIPMALGGLLWVWWALSDHHRPNRSRRVDWIGAGLLTGALVSLDLALLGNAEVQSVSGLEELRGGNGFDFRLLYPVAVILGLVFVRHQRTNDDPVLDRGLLAGPTVGLALIVNFIVGAALVIAMVDVPIFVNAVEIDLERSAVVAGWLLSSMTAGMAITSYVGGRLTEKIGYRWPVTGGLTAAAVAYLVMGLSWEADSSRLALAAMLAVLGLGLGATVAPTTSVVVDEAPPDKRGSAAATVMVVRLLGLSVGLAALTAWALARFNSLRAGLELPSITDPGFEEALIAAQQDLTASAITETFLATAALVAIGVVLALMLRGSIAGSGDESDDTTGEPLMKIDRRTTALVVAVGVLFVTLLGALTWVSRLSSDLDDTQDDLARVEAGSALFAAQVQGFQEQLLELQPTVADGLDAAIEGLETFSDSLIEFTVNVDETVSIDTEVAFDRVVEVPIKTSIPIKETIDTTITIAGPLGIDIPVDVTVPVDLDVPIDLQVEIPISETIPITTNIPIKVDVPISLEVANTELAALADSLAAGLESLKAILSGLGG